MRRKGMVAPVYDWGPFTLAALGRWACDGNHRWPTVDLIFRDRWMAGPSCTGGKALKYRRLTIPLPWVPWYFQYQHPVTRPVHSLFSKLYWRWVKT